MNQFMLKGSDRAFANLFIVLFLSLTTISVLPPSDIQDKLSRAIRPVQLALGLDQNWKLFSPEIRGINFHSQAIVTFKDLSTKFYEFPRVERQEFAEKVRREKISKLLNDCLPWPDFQQFLPDTARFIARANYDPSNPPIRVALSYNWIPVPSFDTFVKQSDFPAQTNRYTFFVYRVQPEDFK